MKGNESAPENQKSVRINKEYRRNNLENLKEEK
jgi:hypothetical protein